jgi:hypothetical protein
METAMAWLYAIFLGWCTAILVVVFMPIRAPGENILTWRQIIIRTGLTIGAVLAWRAVLFIAAAIMASGPRTDRSPAFAPSVPESEQAPMRDTGCLPGRWRAVGVPASAGSDVSAGLSQAPQT